MIVSDALSAMVYCAYSDSSLRQSKCRHSLTECSMSTCPQTVQPRPNIGTRSDMKRRAGFPSGPKDRQNVVVNAGSPDDEHLFALQAHRRWSASSGEKYTDVTASSSCGCAGQHPKPHKNTTMPTLNKTIAVTAPTLPDVSNTMAAYSAVMTNSAVSMM